MRIDLPGRRHPFERKEHGVDRGTPSSWALSAPFWAFRRLLTDTAGSTLNVWLDATPAGSQRSPSLSGRWKTKPGTGPVKAQN
eukprot:9382452-Pyramimonas_sp.AAC.1